MEDHGMEKGCRGNCAAAEAGTTCAVPVIVSLSCERRADMSRSEIGRFSTSKRAASLSVTERNGVQ